MVLDYYGKPSLQQLHFLAIWERIFGLQALLIFHWTHEKLKQTTALDVFSLATRWIFVTGPTRSFKQPCGGVNINQVSGNLSHNHNLGR